MLDPNVESPLLVQSLRSTPSDSPSSTKAQVLKSWADSVPTVDRDDQGYTALIHVVSEASWSSTGGLDVWSLRLRTDLRGEPQWVDRIMRLGIWQLSPAGSDSIRVARR
jgi:hypothetical protein